MIALAAVPDRAKVAAGLENVRRELLDLTLRNPLLNYQARTKDGRKLKPKRIEVIGTTAAEVFEELVQRGRKLELLPDENARHSAEDETEDEPAALPPELLRALGAGSEDLFPTAGDDLFPPEDAVTARRARDLRLRTSRADADPARADSLSRVLVDIHRTARMLVEEQGVNSLFMALGMLRWRDEKGAELASPLVLVPVELERTGVRGRFRVAHVGDGAEPNLTLELRLQDKRVGPVELPPFPDDDEAGLDAYFDVVKESLGTCEWSVDRTAVHLGFFSFSKLLMYRDLDPAAWPPESAPDAHSVVGALLGAAFADDRPATGEPQDLDAALPPERARHVLDADSSQARAVLAVAAGRSMVIEGPPGTGKSQTITNLIADAVARGQNVLFVAEKMAALEVVKRRLDAVGLGQACLELHSSKANKTAVKEELRRVLESGAPGNPDGRPLERVAELRDRVNAFAREVNAPLAGTTRSPYDVFGELLTTRERLERAGLGPYPLTVSSWDEAALEAALEGVRRLENWVRNYGRPGAHPLAISRVRQVTGLETDRLRAAVAGAREALARARSAATAAANAAGTPVPDDEPGLQALERAFRQLGSAPDLGGADALDAGWAAEIEPTERALEAGQQLAELRARHAAALTDAAWEADVASTREDLARVGRAWWRPLSGAYRRAAARVRELHRANPPAALEEQLAALDAITSSGNLRRAVASVPATTRGRLGPLWPAPDAPTTSWEAALAAARFLAGLHAGVARGTVPAWAPALVARGAVPAQRHADALRGAVDGFADALETVRATLELDAGDLGIAAVPFAALSDRLAGWAAAAPRLREIANLNELRDELGASGLGALMELLDRDENAGAHLRDVVRRPWLEALLERAFRERPALARFEGREHEDVIERFRLADRESLAWHRRSIALRHWENLPRGNAGGQLAVLRNEFSKVRRLLPVRTLMARAGNAIQALKPVFMMSPLSIASFVPPGSLEFDLVVFDEASQVTPADAFGAILRGEQTVVVGDREQLPPTSFFGRTGAGDEEAEREPDAEDSGDFESILTLFDGRNAPKEKLSWHYRSRHESLIAASNNLFYKGELETFPSPDVERGERGLVYRHLPQTVYQRGKVQAAGVDAGGESGTNPGEAAEVVAAVLRHTRETPGLTLGVVALNAKQAALIEEAVMKLGDPAARAFLSAHADEKFFVKPLENVQGDERDVILISVGFGRDAAGKISQNFGPINKKGGGRRLNVLFSRARLRCEVFTNLRPEDIEIANNTEGGVRPFRQFLEYARDGHRPAGSVPSGPGAASRNASIGRDHLTAVVKAALERDGLDVRANLGASSYRLDLAVVDARNPRRYLLGIECDGPSYARAVTARDRDRLRGEVLGQMGWRLHRVWSLDWFRDPDGELERLRGAITQALAVPEAPHPSRAPAAAVDLPTSPTLQVVGYGTTVAVEDDEDGSPAASSAVPYELARPAVSTGGLDLHLVSPRIIADWVGQVASVESPVHEAEVARRITDAAGLQRVGSRIQAAIDAGIRVAANNGTVERRGKFVWVSGAARPTVRDRGAFPSAARKLELVCDEELAAAAESVARESFGVRPDELATAVSRRIGFGRLTEAGRGRILELIAAEIRAGRLERQGEHVLARDER